MTPSVCLDLPIRGSRPFKSPAVVTRRWADLGNFIAHGGAFQLMAHLRWFYTFASGQPTPPEEAWDGIFRTVPLHQFFQGADDVVGGLAGAGFPWDRISANVFHITGLYDYIYPNTLEAYMAIENQAVNNVTQKLLLGPWAHNDVLNGKTSVGSAEFGEKAEMGFKRTLRMSEQWYDQFLKGVNRGIEQDAPVKVFVMGLNDWREFDAWPPSSIDYQKWLVSGDTGTEEGKVLVPAGGNVSAATDTFTFNPVDPVPTTGGANFHFFQNNLGPKDQSEIEARNDVLTYTSEPLTENVLLLGPLQAVVYVTSTAPSTDFTAKLVAVQPDGYARNLESGIIRTSYEGSTGGLPTLEAGQVTELRIDMGAVAIQLQPGTRLRLEISSSNFPKYDRNPNTGVDPFQAVAFEPALQTIYYSSDYPTHVLLPLLTE